MGVREIFLIGVLEIFVRRPGDTGLVSWRYLIGVLEIFDRSWRYLIGVLAIFNRCPGNN